MNEDKAKAQKRVLGQDFDMALTSLKLKPFAQTYDGVLLMMDIRKKYPKVNEERSIRRNGPLSRKCDKITWINGSVTDVTFKGENACANKPSKPEILWTKG